MNWGLTGTDYRNKIDKQQEPTLYHTQGTVFNSLLSPVTEKNEKNTYIYICIYIYTHTHPWITLLYTWNMVKQLYFNFKNKIKKLKIKATQWFPIAFRDKSILLNMMDKDL